MILYYLILICLALFLGRVIGYFMVNGTKYLVNKEYAKGTIYTLLAYIIIGLELYALSPRNITTVVTLIIFVSINIFGYFIIRNRIKGAK